MTNKHGFQVGDAVDVRKYADVGGAPEPWFTGYTVRTVEFEDVIVECNGQAFCIGSNRVRQAVI